ncbi:uncharacterized protein A4U43_C10F18370 [Asparagus officinalis]|uniref:Uncharacterized protein n=1 Tax=Asparagus officinalis TaxID=4686 RepID=A0A5P1E3P2_ASPOF|nr:uncharacterized protein A4U43_C10F18370 [Asparagus officinalis]
MMELFELGKVRGRKLNSSRAAWRADNRSPGDKTCPPLPLILPLLAGARLADLAPAGSRSSSIAAAWCCHRSAAAAAASASARQAGGQRPHSRASTQRSRCLPGSGAGLLAPPGSDTLAALGLLTPNGGEGGGGGRAVAALPRG